MVPDHFRDDEVQEFFGEVGIEPGVSGKRPEPFDLHLLARRIGRRNVCFKLHNLKYVSKL